MLGNKGSEQRKTKGLKETMLLNIVYECLNGWYSLPNDIIVNLIEHLSLVDIAK